MIKSIRHKGLRRFFETGSTAGIQSKHSMRLRSVLTELDAAVLISDMNRASYRLHPLTGNYVGRWAVWISGNWRLTFEFKNGNAYIVDYEDYH